MWSYFGFYNNAEGNLIEDGNPVCRACQRKVAVKGGFGALLVSSLFAPRF